MLKKDKVVLFLPLRTDFLPLPDQIIFLGYNKPYLIEKEIFS